MNAIDLLRFQLDVSKNLTANLLADMSDAPLAQPTSKGGNHPMWVAGHLAFAEANLTNYILQGKANPLDGWKDMFGRGSEPSTDASKYPPFEEVLARWDEVRASTLKILDGLSEADLDKPSANPPEGREAFFNTYGKVFAIVGLHAAMHRGQVADARRASNRPVLAV